MSSYESSTHESTRSFRQHEYIISILLHAGFAIGFAFVCSWLLPASTEFSIHNRSQDTTYAFFASMALIMAIFYHGICLLMSLSKPYQFWWVFGIFMLAFDPVLVYRFSKWHGQFKATGDSRSAKYCILATVLSALHLSWVVLCFLSLLSRCYFDSRVNTREAPAVRESGQIDIGENGGAC